MGSLLFSVTFLMLLTVISGHVLMPAEAGIPGNEMDRQEVQVAAISHDHVPHEDDDLMPPEDKQYIKPDGVNPHVSVDLNESQTPIRGDVRQQSSLPTKAVTTDTYTAGTPDENQEIDKSEAVIPEVDTESFREEETESAIFAISPVTGTGYNNDNVDEDNGMKEDVVNDMKKEAMEEMQDSSDHGDFNDETLQSNKTDADSADQYSDIVGFDSEEESTNKTDLDVESNNETDAESIQVMLNKLNVMMESYKQCSQTPTFDDIEQPFHMKQSDIQRDVDDTEQPFHMKQSDIQRDVDTEEENETKRTIKEIIGKLNGLMFEGDRCTKDGDGTKEKGDQTLIEDTVNGASYQPKDQIENETGGGNQLEVVDGHIEADDNDDDQGDDFDWTVFEYYPRKPRPSVIRILCSAEVEDGKTNDVIKDHGHQPDQGEHHHDNGTTTAQGLIVDEDQSCDNQRVGNHRPCIDVFSHESVPAQLCRRLKSLEVELNHVTSQLNSLRQEVNQNQANTTSIVRSEIAQLTLETTAVESKTAFFATAALKSGNINLYTVRVNLFDVFNPEVGIFTVPLSGAYHIFINMNNQITNKQFSIHLKETGASDIAIVSGDGSSSQSFSTLTYLETGQNVWLDVVSEDVFAEVDTNGEISFGAVLVA